MGLSMVADAGGAEGGGAPGVAILSPAGKGAYVTAEKGGVSLGALPYSVGLGGHFARGEVAPCKTNGYIDNLSYAQSFHFPPHTKVAKI